MLNNKSILNYKQTKLTVLNFALKNHACLTRILKICRIIIKKCSNISCNLYRKLTSSNIINQKQTDINSCGSAEMVATEGMVGMVTSPFNMNEFECWWVIRADADKFLRLTFNEFKTNGHKLEVVNI